MFKLSISLSLIMIFVIPSGVYISYKLGHLISAYSEKDIINNKDIKGFMLINMRLQNQKDFFLKNNY